MFAQYASDSRIAQLFRFYHFAEEAFHQQLVKHPYSDEVYYAKEIIELHYGGDRSLLPALFGPGAIDAHPEAQMPVILADNDLLIAALGYKVLKSASTLKPQGFYQRIPHLHQPRHWLREIAEHRLEDTVRRNRLRRLYSLGNAVAIIGGQIFIYQFHNIDFIPGIIRTSQVSR